MDYKMLSVKMNGVCIRRHALFFLFLLIGSSTVYGMEKLSLTYKEPAIWFPVPKDIVIKIFACADLETKKKLRITCSEIFLLDTKDLLHYSPLIVSRKDCLYQMVHAAQHNDQAVFRNLFCNAAYCDYADLPVIATYFLLKESHELALLRAYCTSQNGSTLEQLLPYIMEVYQGGEKIIDHYKTNVMDYPEDKEDASPLSIAVYHNHPRGVGELLLAQNIDLLNMQNFDCWTPLHDAVCANNVAMCTLLLSFKEIKTDILDDDGNTVLHYAVIKNRIPMVKLLLENGVPIDVPSLKNQTALWFASCYGHVDMVKLLLEHKANVEIAATDNKLPTDTIHPLSVAIINREMPIVRLLIEHGANPNARSAGTNCTPLSLAIVNHNYEAAEFLLKNGAHVDAVDSSGYTSLIEAVEKGRIALVRLLLEYGADINHQANDQFTALYAAIMGEQDKIIKFLLEQPQLIIREKEKRFVDAFKNRQKKEDE